MDFVKTLKSTVFALMNLYAIWYNLSFLQQLSNYSVLRLKLKCVDVFNRMNTMNPQFAGRALQTDKNSTTLPSAITCIACEKQVM